MRRLVFAELLVLAAAASVALLLLIIHCCRRGKPPTELLPVSEPRPLPGTSKERGLERLRRVLMRLCSRRSRVEPAAASAGTSPALADAAHGELPAGPEEEVAAWRDRWFGGPGSRELYTIEEESSTSSWTPTALSESERDGESQSGGDRPLEPETPFYTPPASPQHEPNGGRD